jgi:hypothetical protein
MRVLSLHIRLRQFLIRIRKETRRNGLYYVIVAEANWIRNIINNWLRIYLWFYYNKLLNFRNTFVFRRRKYKYFYSLYNTTWRNERAIEIPIILQVLKEKQGEVLEIGNVLSHYFEFKHDIVDKYEIAKGVMTQDVTEIKTSKKYDLIISISTLEHIGWDENPFNHQVVNNPGKILHALAALRNLLKLKGRIVVTFPIGYNPYLDNLLKKGKLGFDERYLMKRAPKGNRWVEAGWEEVKNARFNRQVPTANAIVIGLLENTP